MLLYRGVRGYYVMDNLGCKLWVELEKTTPKTTLKGAYIVRLIQNKKSSHIVLYRVLL